MICESISINYFY